MPDRTKATAPPTASTAGLLRPDEFARHVTLVREPTGESAKRWVENRWSLRWDLPAGRWYDSEVLPHPTCSLTVELGSHPRAGMPRGETVAVTGVCTRRFDVAVRGWGRVVGLRFRPGGLAALTGRPASAWTDRSVAAAEVLPPGLVATLADDRPRVVGQRVGRGGRAGPGRPGRRSARPAVRPAPRRRRRHARRPHPARGDRCRRTARGDGAHPAAAVHALRRRGAEVGARPLPDARRGRRPRRRLGRHAHRARGALRLVRPGPLHPRLHGASSG